MQKKALVATLSMALVLGVAGIVNAATTGSNAHNTLPQPSSATSYMTPTNVTSSGDLQGTTPKTNQINPSTPTSPNEPNHQIQNMPGYTQMQTMPVSTPMNGPMINSQQVMSGTYRSNPVNTSSATQQSGQNSRVRTMMGSKGKMGR
ncbi:hypothetical protein [Desulfosporosinus sp. OT]|uniref:hypothetical protein n=1 Tax=Desulfosporosinus sp. OT TaxID=913865 RepID=UPI000223AB89|nr:hypothetical protein [Desulfosporosinus sp. OT]EGW41158.1 hypothetical protein DOT_0906 [Desulfosporosinus sp. OT]